MNDATNKATETVTLTPKEIAVMRIIRDSEFRDGGELTAPVWSHGMDVPEGMTRRGMGGVIASLQEKGLIGTDQCGKESTVWFTPEGVAALT